MKKIVSLACAVILIAAVSHTLAQETSVKSQAKENRLDIRIKLSSVFVDDQKKAETFYTEVLGFVVKEDIPVGEFRWLTVVAPDNPDGTELLLEPNNNPAARVFHKAMYEQGITANIFFVEDAQESYEKLKKLGVTFTQKPTNMGTIIAAIFDDTCGNLIMIAQDIR